MGRGPEFSEVSEVGKKLMRVTEAEAVLGIAGVALGLGYPAAAIAIMGVFERGLIWAIQKGYLGQESKANKGR